MCPTLGHVTKTFNYESFLFDVKSFANQKGFACQKSFLLLIGLENKRESHVYVSRVFTDGCDNDVLTKTKQNSTVNLGFSFLLLALRKRVERDATMSGFDVGPKKKCCKAVCTIFDHSCQSSRMKNVFLAVKSLCSHQFKLYPK